MTDKAQLLAAACGRSPNATLPTDYTQSPLPAAGGGAGGAADAKWCRVTVDSGIITSRRYTLFEILLNKT